MRISKVLMLKTLPIILWTKSIGRICQVMKSLVIQTETTAPTTNLILNDNLVCKCYWRILWKDEFCKKRKVFSKSNFYWSFTERNLLFVGFFLFRSFLFLLTNFIRNLFANFFQDRLALLLRHVTAHPLSDGDAFWTVARVTGTR